MAILWYWNAGLEVNMTKKSDLVKRKDAAAIAPLTRAATGKMEMLTSLITGENQWGLKITKKEARKLLRKLLGFSRTED